MLVNSKQKIAVLASGLAIATTGFVTDAQASAGGNTAAGPDQSAAVTVVAPAEEK
jgi:hypothetical protein